MQMIMATIEGDSFAETIGFSSELRVSVEIRDGYRFILIEPGKYEAHLLVNGVQCPGKMGVLTGRLGNWQAEWVDGSRVGTFGTLQDGAKALENYRYHV